MTAILQSSNPSTFSKSIIHRAALASCIGLIVATLVYLLLHQLNGANDFQWVYAGAAVWLEGRNPYISLAPYLPSSETAFKNPLYYPFPAVLLASPLTLMSPVYAGAVFSGLSAAILAFAVLGTGEPWRLLMFFSAPAFMAFANVQWSPLFLAALMLPALGCLSVCKPTLGLVALLTRPQLRSFGLAGLLLFMSLALFPTWPIDWLHNVRSANHLSPVRFGIPGLLLLSLIAWRRPAGRMMALWSLVPSMVFFYDALMLWFIPTTWRQMWMLTALSWVAFALVPITAGEPGFGARPYEYWLIYVPALGMLLWSHWRERSKSKVSVPMDGTNSGL